MNLEQGRSNDRFEESASMVALGPPLVGTREQRPSELSQTTGSVLGELVILQQYQKLIYCRIHQQILPSGGMKDVICLLLDLLTTRAKLLRPPWRQEAWPWRTFQGSHTR
jgi:hypothetical protein